MNLTPADIRALAARGITIPGRSPAQGFRTVRSARSTMRPGDSATPRPRIDPAMEVRIVAVQVEARNPLNGRQNKRWGEAERRKQHRLRTMTALLSAPGTLPPLRVRVTMTRHAPGTLDEWDGLPASLKSVVDGVAQAYGCGDDDRRFEWAKPGQVKTKRGVWFVVVRIEHVTEVR